MYQSRNLTTSRFSGNQWFIGHIYLVFYFNLFTCCCENKLSFTITFIHRLFVGDKWQLILFLTDLVYHWLRNEQINSLFLFYTILIIVGRKKSKPSGCKLDADISYPILRMQLSCIDSLFSKDSSPSWTS